MSKQCENCHGWDVVVKKMSGGNDVFLCTKCNFRMDIEKEVIVDNKQDATRKKDNG